MKQRLSLALSLSVGLCLQTGLYAGDAKAQTLQEKAKNYTYSALLVTGGLTCLGLAGIYSWGTYGLGGISNSLAGSARTSSNNFSTIGINIGGELFTGILALGSGIAALGFAALGSISTTLGIKKLYNTYKAPNVAPISSMEEPD